MSDYFRSKPAKGTNKEESNNNEQEKENSNESASDAVVQDPVEGVPVRSQSMIF
jgi:hypothetical protein